jgi:hypothetical protein
VKVKDEGSRYTNMNAVYGGVYYLKDSFAEIEGIEVKNSLTQYGGVIYSVDSSRFNITKSKFQNTQASYSGGAILILRSSLLRKVDTISISETEITDTYANSEGGTIYLENDGIDLSLINVKVKNTSARYASGGFISVSKG